MWYYVEDGQQRGPVVDADFEALRREGKVVADTLIWREGMESWQPLSQVVDAPGGAALRMASTPVAAAAPTAGAAPAGGWATVTCSECGRIFPASEVIRYGNASVCAACKPVFMQKLREGASVASGPMEYAGFWIRFAAQFVDGIITQILAFVGGAAVGGVMGAAGVLKSGPSGVIAVQFAGMAVAIVISAGYYIYLTGKDGQTLGKKLCKVKVVNADGSEIGYAKSTGRYFSYIVSYLICLIGFMMAGWDDEKRALHDRICDTRVIKL